MNLLAIGFVAAAALLFNFNWKYSSEIVVLYGFANNQELNINMEHAANVQVIYVQPGQKVQKGDVLLDVNRASIAVSQSNINHDIQNLYSQYQIWESGLSNSIRTLKAQKVERKNELQSAIKKLESEMSINATLIKEIDSVDPIEDANGNNPRQIELNGLIADLRLSMRTFDAEINKLHRELKNPENPLLIQIEKLNNNLSFVQDEEESLNIVAQQEGIIGTIFCKVGENIPAFSPYLSIYEESPNHVKGYVLESLILKVNVGDTLQIQSVSHPEESIYGAVIGMGSRIVEIPPRLRKNPAFVTYGREVEIKIPSQNPFLQNEKVILKRIDPASKLWASTDQSFQIQN